MKSVGTFEAKTYLPRLLKDVERGESIIITRNGHPVARLSPVGRGPMRDPHAAMQRLLLSKATLRGLSIKKLRDEGRRLR